MASVSPASPEKLSNDLYQDGVCVIPVFSEDPVRLSTISTMFQSICENAPELLPLTETNNKHWRFVLGGVGYIPFASVMYHPEIRALYKEAFETAINLDIFKTWKENRFTVDEINSPGKIRVGLLPDRALYRFPDQIVDENGKWHRDIAPYLNSENQDICFGGWVNLNYNTTQYFKCYKGSHNETHEIYQKLQTTNRNDNNGIGFSNFKTKEDQKALKDNWKTMGGPIIEIPPGHMVIFRENIIHVVMKNPPMTNPMLRIHLGFLVSTNHIPLHDRSLSIRQAELQRQREKGKGKGNISEIDQNRLTPLRDLFAKQALIPVRSGQGTGTYSPMNLFGRNKLHVERLTSYYIPECVDPHTGYVSKYLPSLEKLNMMHIPMSADELAMYFC